MTTTLPPLPLATWAESKQTLHLYLQVVGKLRLALHPTLNHWWHATLYPSAHGLRAQAIPAAGEMVELEFNLVDHLLVVSSSNQPTWQLPLRDGLSVAEFYGSVMEQLARLEVRPKLLARPYDPALVGSDLPFAEDTRTATTPRRWGASGAFWPGHTGCFPTFGGALTAKVHPFSCSGTP